MADVIDQANDRAERDTALAAQQRKPVGPEWAGYCHNCGKDLPWPARWCDADCRDDWERGHV